MNGKNESIVRETNFFNLDTKETLDLLKTTTNGLSQTDAAEFSKIYGKNELIEESKEHWIKSLIAQFNNILIYTLVLSAVISIFLGKVVEPIAILTIVVLAGITGFIQEFQAGKAIDSLKKMASPFAKVFRDGLEQHIPSSELVPGDVIILAAGDKIPADCRVIEAQNLKIDEAALTGESLSVTKHDRKIDDPNTPLGDRKNMLYMGTAAVYGRGKAVVAAIGMNTEFGKIAGLLSSTDDKKTPLQVNLDKLGKQLGIFSIILATLVSIFDYLRGSSIYEVFLWGVSLAVAIIPEALPAVVTITLALGVKRMVKRRALIRKLPAVETLGATNIICSDKTGTLTQDEMTITRIFTSKKVYDVTGVGYKPEGNFIHNNQQINPKDELGLKHLLISGSLCNDTALNLNDGEWQLIGDPTEGSLVVAAEKAGFNTSTLRSEHTRIFEIPFSSETKRMTTVHNFYNNVISISKGAPEVILDSCSTMYVDGGVVELNDLERKKILGTATDFGSDALRVLALAYKTLDSKVYTPENIEQGLVFIGFIGMIDPPREEVKDAIKTCERAGIKPIMITGDHKVTAVAVAKELGIMKSGIALSGTELEKMSDEEFLNIVDKTEVYARISPAHKMKIVDTLMKRGNIVAMTGDGVNDAPSLKRADIGVAMGITGTDVSKEASDMILTDDNFASIVSAVEEGRSIFENIRKYLVFLLGGNMGTVFGLVAALLIGFPVPLLAVHILFINFIMDGILAITLGVEPPEKGIMDRHPRPANEGILNKASVWTIGIMGLWIAFVTMMMFIYYGGAYPDPSATKSAPFPMTIFYATLIMARIFNGLSSRSISDSFFTYGLKGNMSLIYGIIATLILTILTINLDFMNPIFNTTQLSLNDWLIITLAASSVLVFSEFYKAILRKIVKD